MKWKIIFTLLVVIFLGLWCAFDSLEGYCISDRRRYSDDELINLAIANLLMSYPQPASGYDDYRESFRGKGWLKIMITILIRRMLFITMALGILLIKIKDAVLLLRGEMLMRGSWSIGKVYLERAGDL